jgi:hypothetical protein
MFKKLIEKFEAPRPSYATWEEWDEWREQTRKKYPIRYFLFDTLPSIIKHAKMRFIEPVYYWFYYRTVNRMHVIKPKSLRPGYVGCDARMLHSCFEELRRYVEDSLGRRNFSYYWVGRNDSKRKHQTRQNLILAGLDYLDQIIDGDHVSPSHQEVAKEIKVLYLWWTVDRVQRLNSITAEKLVSLQTPEDVAKIEKGNWNPNNVGASTRYFWSCANALQTFYDDQDQAMLEILVKHRLDLI